MRDAFARDVDNMSDGTKHQIRRLVQAGQFIAAGRLVRTATGITNGAVVVQALDRVCGHQVGATIKSGGENLAMTFGGPADA